MKNIKKIVFTIAFFGILITPFFASAATIEELQAKINALVKQIAELQVQLSKLQAIPPAFCHTFNTNLRVGDTGDEMVALRSALAREGIQVNSQGEGREDLFEEAVASAVSAFQEKYKSQILTPAGLTSPTGYVGPRTRAKLNALYGCGITQPSITVLSPNGGEVWRIGETKTVSWTYPRMYLGSTISSLSIELWKGNQFVRSMDASGTPAPTSLQWSVTNNLTPGSDYKIKILESNNPSNFDWSDAPFSIVAE